MRFLVSADQEGVRNFDGGCDLVHIESVRSVTEILVRNLEPAQFDK